MLPFQVLKKDYTFNAIDSATEIYGVIGDPIEQSLSPAVHNAAFRHLGLNKVMVPFLVPNGELPAFLNELQWLNIKGCSVTIPHKEAIVPLLQSRRDPSNALELATRLSFKRTASASVITPIIGRPWTHSRSPLGGRKAMSPRAFFATSRY